MMYGLSVLLKNPEAGQTKSNFLLHHLPWLIGSLGVLLLDIIVSLGISLQKNMGWRPRGKVWDWLLGSDEKRLATALTPAGL